MSVTEKERINNKIRPIFSVLVLRKQEQEAGGDKKQSTHIVLQAAANTP